jgi:hypothetical protein
MELLLFCCLALLAAALAWVVHKDGLHTCSPLLLVKSRRTCLVTLHRKLVWL